MAITAALGGDVSFTLTGDGSAVTVDVALADLATLIGVLMPAAITAVDLIDFSLPSGSPGITCRPSVGGTGGDAITLDFSAALANATNYSIALRLWA